MLRDVLAVTILFLAVACGGDNSRSRESALPAAADPAFGFVGNALISDKGRSEDATADRMWVGASLRFSAQSLRSRVGDDFQLIGGVVIASPAHPQGFYFDPDTTATAARVDADKRTTLDAIRQSPVDFEHSSPDHLNRWWIEVTVERFEETPAACEDGYEQLAEDCDLPMGPCRQRHDDLTTEPRTCRSDCSCPPACGNGVVDSFVEQCDDGNDIDGDGCSGCLLDPVLVLRDFSVGLTEFHFQRIFGLGFCPESGSLRHVGLAREATTGALRLTASRFGDFPNGTFICDPFSEADCPPIIDIPARTLTADEEADLLAAFREVVVSETSGLFCGADDRCLFHRFRWTNTSTDSGEFTFVIDENECAPRLLDDEVARLVEVLERVVAVPSDVAEADGTDAVGGSNCST